MALVEATPFSVSAIAMRSPRSSYLAIENALKKACVDRADDRRMTQRYKIEEPITIQPLDAGFLPSGFEQTALAHSISHCGIGMTTVQRVKSDFLRVTFESCSGDSNHSIVIKVKHQTQRGATYLIGGQLEVDWSVLQDATVARRVGTPEYKLALLLNIRGLLRG